MVANNKAEWVSSARHEGALFAAPLNGRTMVNRWRVAHCIDSFTGSFSAVHGRPFGGAGAYRWGSLEQSDPLSSPFFDALLSAFLVRLRCHSTMLLMVNRLLETCPRPALDIVESLSLSLSWQRELGWDHLDMIWSKCGEGGWQFGQGGEVGGRGWRCCLWIFFSKKYVIIISWISRSEFLSLFLSYCASTRYVKIDS